VLRQAYVVVMVVNKNAAGFSAGPAGLRWFLPVRRTLSCSKLYTQRFGVVLQAEPLTSQLYCPSDLTGASSWSFDRTGVGGRFLRVGE
jgi:hypothetical protein